MQVKILVKGIDDSEYLRSELCIGMRFGSQTDNPCTGSSYSCDNSFKNSAIGAEGFAAELTGAFRGEQRMSRELILTEPVADGFQIDLEGRSASATLLFAHLVSYRYGLASPPSASFSCTIDFHKTDPVYEPVQFIGAKVQAAIDAGLRTLFVHEENISEAKTALGQRTHLLNLVPVSGSVRNSWEEKLAIFCEGSANNEAELDRVLEEQKEIEEEYGPSRSSRISQTSYYSKVMPVKVREMQRKWKEQHGKQDIDCLICSVSSADLVVMAYWCLLPRNLILIMGSNQKENEKVITQIKRFVLDVPGNKSGMRLKPENMKICELEEHNKPYDNYTKIDSRLRRFLSTKKTVFAEITGGTKPMSTVLAQYAWQHNLQAVYIESKYADGKRIDGTQQLTMFPEPKEISKDDDFQSAMDLFNEGLYDTAGNRFRDIAADTDNPKVSRFMAVLSQFYSNRMQLRFEAAAENAHNLNAQLNEKVFTIMPDGVKQNLSGQLKRASEICDECRLSELYVVADRRMGMGDYNTSLILFYRFLEGVVASRLMEYGIETGEPNYSSILAKISKDKLVQLMQEKLASIGSCFLTDGELPARIGLLMGAALLESLNDEIVTEGTAVKFYNLAEIRNESILAHGFKSATRKICSILKNEARRIFTTALKKHISSDAEAFFEQMAFQEIEQIN